MKNFSSGVTELQVNLDADFQKGVRNLVQNQIQCLANIIEIDENSESTHANSNKLPSDMINKSFSTQKENKNIVYQNLLAYEYIEPRLIMIGHILYFTNQIGIINQNGSSLKVSGFRLINLTYWAKYPIGSIIDALGCICSYCDARCKFCFRLSSSLSRFSNKILRSREANTLIKYYDMEKKVGLPIPLHDTGEVFINPDLFDILGKVRNRDKKFVINDLTTHGSHLNDRTVEELSKLKPIFLVVSLNTVDPDNRERVMGYKSAPKTIHAIPLLRKSGIPFIGSIVPWPEYSMEEVERTIRFLDVNEAYLIRICLPSFTRFSHPIDPFDTDNYWSELSELIKKLREELSTPFLVQPSWYLRQEIRAHVDGVVKNSPASDAGLRFGDRILSINERIVITRNDVANELVRLHKEGSEVKLGVLRDSQELSISFRDDYQPEDDVYPYKPIGYYSDPKLTFGIHFIDSFPLESVLEMRRIIKKYPTAKKILLFTTRLGKGLFGQALALLMQSEEFDLPWEKIRYAIADHNHWGGNIIIGDLHVVQDYIDRIFELQRNGYQPDLILIPSSFTLGKWKIDTLGNSYLDIERKTGIRVELVPIHPAKV